jgi:surface antigen
MTFKPFIAAATAIAIALGAAGCSQTTGPNEAGGTVLGAVAGGLIGSRFGGGAGKVAAVMAGTMIGGFLGNQVGKSLDNEAQARAAEAQAAAVASGRRSEWRGESGSYGYVEPGPAYTDANGTCRTYTHTIYIDGRPRNGTGTACRNPDGTWQIVS